MDTGYPGNPSHGVQPVSAIVGQNTAMRQAVKTQLHTRYALHHRGEGGGADARSCAHLVPSSGCNSAVNTAGVRRLSCSCLSCRRLSHKCLCRLGKRMMSWTRRPPEELAPVQEDSQDDQEAGSPPADATADLAASGAASPARSHPGAEHTLREKYTDSGDTSPTLATAAESQPPQPTLTAAAKDVPLQPSASAFSPFAAVAGSALDTAEEDDLEVAAVHERLPSGTS